MRVTAHFIRGRHTKDHLKERTRHASVESSDGSPLAGTLLTSLVKNLGYERLAIVVLELEDVGSDLDKEGVKDTLVPGVKDVGDLILREAETTLENVVRLCNQLHVTVLDTLRPWNVRKMRARERRV